MKNSSKWVFAVVIALLFCVAPAFSQKKKSSSPAYDWGIGLKAGSPTGLTLKKYNGDKAWELVIGTDLYNNDYGYYWNHNDKYKGYKGQGYAYDPGYYNRSYNPFVAQWRYIFLNKQIGNIDGFNWFLGVGGQFRFSSFRYYYSYWDKGIYHYGEDRATYIGIGADVLGGVEYKIKNVPISVGADVNVYIEGIQFPGRVLPMGAVYGRYNF